MVSECSRLWFHGPNKNNWLFITYILVMQILYCLDFVEIKEDHIWQAAADEKKARINPCFFS